MSSSLRLAPAPSASAHDATATRQTPPPAEPLRPPTSPQAREAADTREAINHITMEPGAIIGLTASLNAERNDIALTVAVMRHKQDVMETVLDTLKRPGA